MLAQRKALCHDLLAHLLIWHLQVPAETRPKLQKTIFVVLTTFETLESRASSLGVRLGKKKFWLLFLEHQECGQSVGFQKCW